MNNFFRRLWNFLTDLVPTTVPQGRTAFNSLIDRLILTYSPPTSRRDVEWIVCTVLQRLNPLQGLYPRIYFALALKRAAAGQVGVMIMQELKEQQVKEFKEQQDAAIAAKQAEATATPVANGTEPVQNELLRET